MKWMALTALMMVTPAAAQDLNFDLAHTSTCVNGADVLPDKRACIGASADACMNSTPDGSSTTGMVGCMQQELEYWDQRLNSSYALVMEEAERLDTMNRENSSALASEAEALRDMQRAWIPFRDATCHYERNQWGGGTGSGPAMVACLMNMTAEQALFLEQRLGP